MKFNLAALLLSVTLMSAPTMAEYLALTETMIQRQAGQMGGGCHDGDPSYDIRSYASHPRGTGSECSNKNMGRVVSVQENWFHDYVGCTANSGWKNGYRVCKTRYGVNIHKNGKHQRCPKDSANLYHCPNVMCWTTTKRIFKCEGVWHND